MSPPASNRYKSESTFARVVGSGMLKLFLCLDIKYEWIANEILVQDPLVSLN